MSTFSANNAGPYAGVYTEPDDGAAPDAASVNTFVEGVANDLAYVRGGNHYEVQPIALDNGEPPWTYIQSITGSTGYHVINDSAMAWTGAKAGDVLEVTCTLNVGLVKIGRAHV